MSAEDQRAAKLILKDNYEQAKEKLAILRSKADEYAKGLEKTAVELRNNPEDFPVKCDSELVAEFQEIRKLIDDIKATIEEKQRFEGRLIEGGIPYTP